ncbi:MAG: ROK family protein, partial [Nocardioidaceae bacterium]
MQRTSGAEHRRSGVPATPGEVFQLVRSQTARTRSGVGRLTGLSRTAVSARLQLLLRSGLVVEGEEDPSTGGRPATTLRFDRHSGVVLAAAVGRSRTQLAVCDLAGDVLTQLEVEQEPGAEPEDVMPDLVDRLDALVRAAGREPGDVRGVGVSIPGSVDRERGMSLDSPILPGWNRVPLAPYLRRLTATPVVVDNDANVMALSERRGHLESYEELLMVKASTG